MALVTSEEMAESRQPVVYRWKALGSSTEVSEQTLLLEIQERISRVRPEQIIVLGFVPAKRNGLKLERCNYADADVDLGCVVEHIARCVRGFGQTKGLGSLFKQQTRLVREQGARLNSLMTTVWMVPPSTADEEVRNALAQISGIAFLNVIRGKVTIGNMQFERASVIAAGHLDEVREGLKRHSDTVLLVAGVHKSLPTLAKTLSSKVKQRQPWLKVMEDVTVLEAAACTEHTRRAKKAWAAANYQHKQNKKKTFWWQCPADTAGNICGWWQCLATPDD